MMEGMTANTIGVPKMFEANGCRLKYTPSYKETEGMNLVLLAHMREVTYGYYDGTCEVEGKTITFDRAWGFFELVYTRL